MALPRNLTLKTQEALQAAKSIAQDSGQQELSPLHLLSSLIQQEDSLVGSLLQKLGIDKDKVKERGIVYAKLQKDKVVFELAS